MCGGFITLMCFLLQCQPNAKHCFIAFNAVAGARCVKALLSDEFASPENRITRALTFGSLFATALVPLLYVASSSACQSCAVKEDILTRLVWFMISQAIGAAFFASRIPERFAPGTFDYVLQSHQLFHCCVVFGIHLFYDVMELVYAQRFVISSVTGTC